MWFSTLGLPTIRSASLQVQTFGKRQTADQSLSLPTGDITWQGSTTEIYRLLGIESPKKTLDSYPVQDSFSSNKTTALKAPDNRSKHLATKETKKLAFLKSQPKKKRIVPGTEERPIDYSHHKKPPKPLDFTPLLRWLQKVEPGMSVH